MQPRSDTPRWQRAVARILVHGAVATIGATLLGAAVLWPRWSRWQEARSALLMQGEVSAELRARQGSLQAVQASFDDWSARRRRAVLPAEVPAFLTELRRLLKPTGVQILRLDADAPTAPVAAPAPSVDPAAPAPAALRPMAVTLVLQGSFPAIYRSLTRLEAQRFLAIVQTAEMTRPAVDTAQLRAFLRLDLFLLQTGEDHLTATLPQGSVPATASKIPRG